MLQHLVAQAGVLPDEVWAPKRSNGGGALDGDQVAALAGFLAERVRPSIAPGSRMFFDGSVTDAPDDGTFYRAEDELWKNYSLTREVLDRVVDFLLAAAGPVTVH